jgi:hypothetical protein
MDAVLDCAVNAESVALVPHSAHRGTDDEPAELAFYCPACAEREFPACVTAADA